MLSPTQILALMPQRPPFLFVDELLEVDAEHAVGRYTFPPEADYYRGHFPGRPVTPGVILIEALCQVGLVALGIYLGAADGASGEGLLTLFTNVDVEFARLVRPGETVTVHARKRYWRMRKLQAEATMRAADGAVVCSGTVAGMAVAAARVAP